MKKKSKAKILVADDDAISLKVVCQMLGHLGYDTVAAKNGHEALASVTENNCFDLVLTDINMSQIDGWQLADRIKALNPDMPIVAITGESPNSIFPRLQGSAIRHALFKPVKINHLKEAISEILVSARPT